MPDAYATRTRAAYFGQPRATLTPTPWSVPQAGANGQIDPGWLPGGSAFVDVITYGADPTGVADSRAAFVAAIAAVSTDGGVVLLPPGEYYTSASIPITSSAGITILGCGAASVVKSNLPGDGNKFAITGDNVTIANLKIDGGYVSGPQSGSFGLINVGDCKYATIKDCIIVNSIHRGIQMLGNSEDVSIVGCKFSNNFCCVYSLDVDSTHTPKRITIALCSFLDGWSDAGETGGIKLQNLHSDTGSGHVICNCTFRNSGQMGLELWNGIYDCVVSGNTISQVEFGISLDRCSRTTVCNNTISQFSYVGIENANECEGNSITGNRMALSLQASGQYLLRFFYLRPFFKNFKVC
jgi:parallel beta-helix repeat protein